MVCTFLIGYLGQLPRCAMKDPFDNCSNFPAPTFPPLTALGLRDLRFILTLKKKKYGVAPEIPSLGDGGRGLEVQSQPQLF